MSGPVSASHPKTAQLFTPDGLFRHTFEAMGTTISVLLPRERASEMATVETVVASWSAIFTRFDSRSELSRLNAAGGRPCEVSELLFDALLVARQAACASDGLFDPTLLRSLEWIGYDRDFEAIADSQPGPAPRDPRPSTGGWRQMHLDREHRSAQLPPGVGLDLGGLAKGMAVDAAMNALKGRGIRIAAVDAGGDLAVIGLPPAMAAWAISIEGPRGHPTVSLTAGALATSSIARRRWRQGQEFRHHLIDPRTGLPSTVGLWSVSVAAPTCAQAEVAAKAAYLLGPDLGSTFLRERGLSGLFIHGDGSEQSVSSRAGR